MVCSRLALYCPWTQSRSALWVEHLKIFKTKAASDIWNSREILRCIILGENISVQIVQTPGHGWPEQDRQSSCTVQKGQNRMYFQNSLSVYTAARENTCDFLYFSTLYSAEGAESARAIPNAQAKQSSRPTVLSDSNWPHWWQRHRMFGVIGLHWEPSYRRSPQHHCIRHWSCLIGRSTCKSYSGWKPDDFMDLIIQFDRGAQIGSNDCIFTLH